MDIKAVSNSENTMCIYIKDRVHDKLSSCKNMNTIHVLNTANRLSIKYALIEYYNLCLTILSSIKY